MKKCAHCNQAFEDSAQFCTICGQPLTPMQESAIVAPPFSPATVPEATLARRKPWHFGVRYLSGNKLHTKIRAEGTRLYIEQYKRILLFFKVGAKRGRLEAGEILSLRQEKEVSAVAVLEIIIGIWALLLGKYQGLFVLLLGIWGLRNSYLILTCLNGEIRIGDGARWGSNMDGFLSYIGQHSPNCRRDGV